MPKDFGPKQVAKKLKAAGLQKLKWFCQVCEKQCRDENGYRNHVQSESHQRKLLVVAENPTGQIEEYSQEFLQGFLGILERRYGQRRVFANQVYQEYVSDRNHLHMNATKWATLGQFIAYLGRRGLCEVERTDRGWYIEWIDNSPHELARRQQLEKMNRQNEDQEERDRRMIEEQIERGKAHASASTSAAAQGDTDVDYRMDQKQEKKQEFKRDGSISFGIKGKVSLKKGPAKKLFEAADDDVNDEK